MPNEDVKITIGVEDKASKAIHNIEKSEKELANTTGKLRDALAKTAVAMGSVATAGVYAMSKWIKLASDQMEAEQRVAMALKRNKIYTEQAFKSILKYASSLQNLTAIGDERLLPVIARLIDATGSYKKALSLLPGIIGVAAAKQVKFETVIRAVEMAFNGTTSTLKRYGIALDENTARTDTYQALMNALAVYQKDAYLKTETLAGKFKDLSNAIGDLGEEIGKAIIPIISRYIDLLKTATVKTTEFVSNHKKMVGSFVVGTTAISGFISAAAGIGLLAIGLKPIISGFKSVILTIGEATSSLFGFVSAFNIFAGTGAILKDMIASVTILVGGLNGVLNAIFEGSYKAVVLNITIVKTFVSAIKQDIANMIATITVNMEILKTYLASSFSGSFITVFHSLYSIIRNNLVGIVSFLTKLMGILTVVLTIPIKKVSDVLGKVFINMTTTIVKAVSSLTTVIYTKLTSLPVIIGEILILSYKQVINILNWIVKAIVNTFNFIMKHLVNISTWLGKLIASIIVGPIELALMALSKILTVDFWKTLATFVIKVLGAIGEIIWGTIKGLTMAIGNFLIGIYNKMADLINKMISKYNQLASKLNLPIIPTIGKASPFKFQNEIETSIKKAKTSISKSFGEITSQVNKTAPKIEFTPTIKQPDKKEMEDMFKSFNKNYQDFSKQMAKDTRKATKQSLEIFDITGTYSYSSRERSILGSSGFKSWFGRQKENLSVKDLMNWDKMMASGTFDKEMKSYIDSYQKSITKNNIDTSQNTKILELEKEISFLKNQSQQPQKIEKTINLTIEGSVITENELLEKLKSMLKNNPLADSI